MTFSRRALTTMPPSRRDVHLTDQAQAALLSLPYGSLRQVGCRVEQSRIVLSGNVASFYQKQLAQVRLRQCLGTEMTIINDLQVVNHP